MREKLIMIYSIAITCIVSTEKEDQLLGVENNLSEGSKISSSISAEELDFLLINSKINNLLIERKKYSKSIFVFTNISIIILFGFLIYYIITIYKACLEIPNKKLISKTSILSYFVWVTITLTCLVVPIFFHPFSRSAFYFNLIYFITSNILVFVPFCQKTIIFFIEKDVKTKDNILLQVNKLRGIKKYILEQFKEDNKLSKNKIITFLEWFLGVTILRIAVVLIPRIIMAEKRIQFQTYYFLDTNVNFRFLIRAEESIRKFLGEKFLLNKYKPLVNFTNITLSEAIANFLFAIIIIIIDGKLYKLKNIKNII